MKTVLFCCADNAVLDNLTKNVSVFNVYSKVELPKEQLPGLFQRLAAAMIFKKEAADPPSIDVKLEISLNGKLLHELPMNFDFGNKNMINGVAVMNNRIQFHEFGILTFALNVGGAVLATYQIDLVQRLTPGEMDSATKPPLPAH